MSIVYEEPNVLYEDCYSYDGTPILCTYVGISGGVGSDLWFTCSRDDNGVLWGVEIPEGWDDGADVRESLIDRPFADGQFVGDFWYAGRPYTLKGALLVERDQAARNVAIQQLAAATHMMRGALGTLTVVEVGIPARIAFVRRSGRPRVRRVDCFGAEFEIGFVAPDPRKWSADLHTDSAAVNASLVVANAGDADIPAQITIDGPVTDPVIELGGVAKLSFDLTMIAGDSLVVDLDMRTALLNGVSVRSTLVTPVDWFLLDPGDNTLEVSGTGAGTWDVAWRDGWW